MSDKDLKELDKLFQLGSEQYDFEYNTGAWDQMETLLNKDERKRRFIWWFFIGLGSLLLIGTAWYYAALPSNDISEIPANQLLIEQNIPTEQNIDSQLKKETDTLETVPVIPAESIINKEEEIPAEQSTKYPIAINQPIIDKQSNGEPNISISNKNAATAIIKQEDTIVSQENNGLRIRIASAEFVESVSSDTTQLIASSSQNRSETNNNKKRLPAAVSVPSLPYTLLINNKTEPKLDTIEILAKKSTSRQRTTNARSDNALHIGFVVATEVTALGTDNITKPNFKAGLHLEHGYNQKYSLNIGANYIRKDYEAGAGEYTPPKGFWTRKIAPQSTQGICNILEVPITMGYFFKGHQQAGFYAKGGLTSYFMLRERYDYFYDLPDTDLIREWGTDDVSQHWFGVGQLSFGHQQIYNNGFSKQLAVYIQAPLTGIGHGNVKMWSLGLNLKVNFKLR